MLFWPVLSFNNHHKHKTKKLKNICMEEKVLKHSERASPI